MKGATVKMLIYEDKEVIEYIEKIEYYKTKLKARMSVVRYEILAKDKEERDAREEKLD